MSEYLRLRAISELNNSSLPKDHPCKRGVARCCTSTVPVSEDDKKLIKNAFKSGEFSESVRLNAIRNANSRKPICPFLNKRKECTIYSKRPLICVATGTMAIPKSPEAAEKLQKPGIEGLPMSELASSMCKKCHNIEQKRNRGVNIQALHDSQDIAYYYGSGLQTPIEDFVKQDLDTK